MHLRLVCNEARLGEERPVTHVAEVVFLAEVELEMQLKVSFDPESLAARWTLEFFHVGVTCDHPWSAYFPRYSPASEAQFRAHRLVSEALPALRRNTELQPMSPYGWYQMARLHASAQRSEEALRIIRHLKGFEPKVAAQLERETGLSG